MTGSLAKAAFEQLLGQPEANQRMCDAATECIGRQGPWAVAWSAMYEVYAVSPADEIGLLSRRILQIAPAAGLKVTIRIEEAKDAADV